MREILFKGFSPNDNGKQIITLDGKDYRGNWVEGYYVADNWILGKIIDWDDEYVTPKYWWRVIPETVCEFTGLLDKHGKKIFEGDTVYFMCDLDGELNEELITVYWDEKVAGFLGKSNESDLPVELDFVDEGEVVGDIFDTRSVEK